jgi:AcrR family transcriptional regulator
MTGVATNVDGRTARRSRGMDHVLDAMIELFTEGNLDPTPEQVAALAGVSSRTVYRYFEDRTALVRAAIDRHFEGIAPLAEVPRLGDGTLDERIDRIVAARVRLFDAVAAAFRAATAKSATDAIIADRLAFTRDALREQVLLQFQTELDAMGTDQGTARAAAIELLVSLASLDGLRRTRGLSAAETTAVLTDALTALLTTPERSSGPSTLTNSTHHTEH